MSTARRVLAISPHLDDAALSVGATLAHLATHGADVCVVTLFAGTPTEPLSTVARTFHTTCGLPEDATAVAVRSDEDRAAMDELGARAQHGGFLDAIYRRAPNGSWLCGHDQAMFDDLPLDQDTLLGALSREVNRILAAMAPDLVLTCAAIGDHLDHRLTTAAVRNAVNGTGIQTLLWEDLPYAINHPPVTTTPSPAPITSPQAWHRKWRAIACYTTQVRMLWPANTNWAAELVTHATTRGEGTPTELMFPTNSSNHSTWSRPRSQAISGAKRSAWT